MAFEEIPALDFAARRGIEIPCNHEEASNTLVESGAIDSNQALEGLVSQFLVDAGCPAPA
jgi:hypothetical protein